MTPVPNIADIRLFQRNAVETDLVLVTVLLAFEYTDSNYYVLAVVF